MSEYMFGITRIRPTAQVAEQLDRICREEGGTGFQWCGQAGVKMGWFTGPNRGAPFDRNLRDRVLRRVANVHPDLFNSIN